MLATLGGDLALVVGLAVLLLPVVAAELSRPRDSAWGAVVLLLGLVLVTSSERLTGAPMLGVLCGGLLIGRLGLEVGQSRWRALTPEEQQRLWSRERWQASLGELGASLGRLLELAAGSVAGVLGWLRQRRQPRPTTKRWVRQEPATGDGAEAPAPPVVVASLDDVEVLLETAQTPESGASSCEAPSSTADDGGETG
ncbi:Ycf66 family protein [Cyanobium sp. NIES-981]|uniref:Ycf66 family protein n=1 Tax=Cyanobium sp. NIES-981 TaxID=1851505 RepID=UPI0007DDA500|nr:Ycf66 family protein [Cyanobium sp. NIES-981]SBO43639.1 conserved protein of unknown function [Cyanobium sp. NIES-981]